MNRLDTHMYRVVYTGPCREVTVEYDTREQGFMIIEDACAFLFFLITWTVCSYKLMCVPDTKGGNMYMYSHGDWFVAIS